MITRDTLVRMLETDFLTILMQDHNFTAEQAEAKLMEARRKGIIDMHVAIAMHKFKLTPDEQNVC